MNCEQALDLIQRNLDGDLSAWETAILEKHLTVCSKCEQEKQDLEELSSSLSRLPQAVPPINIVDRVLIQMDTNSKKPFYRSFLGWIAGSAAVMVGALLLWQLANGPTNEKMFSAETENNSTPQSINSLQGQDSDPKPLSIWSPDGQYHAQVEERQVVVYTQDGKVYFRSSQWAKGGDVDLLWTGDQQLTLQLKWQEKKREEIRQIDLSQEQPIEVMIEDGS